MSEQPAKKTYDNSNTCAIWIKRNEDNSVKLLSIEVNIDGKVTKFTAWKNDYKKADTHPDYRGKLATNQGVANPGFKLNLDKSDDIGF